MQINENNETGFETRTKQINKKNNKTTVQAALSLPLLALKSSVATAIRYSVTVVSAFSLLKK